MNHEVQVMHGEGIDPQLLTSTTHQRLGTCHGSTVQLIGQEVLQWTAEQRQEPRWTWMSRKAGCDPKGSKGVVGLRNTPVQTSFYEQMKWRIRCLFPVNSICEWQAICKPTSVESLADSCQDQCCTNNLSKTFP